MTSDRFASFLASYPIILDNEERKQVKNEGEEHGQNIRYEKDGWEVKSRTDLLLGEITREKQRKGMSDCYEEAMSIKLT